ncbi:MAG: DUF1501 domain-containing protein [Planctomycetaceae bacterium]|jgi:hypothetical protein|nr:DUF1501 domain-containing protein [Planctomycetaceae bacterium]MBT4726074.1 DUF1501 domain-containing protein [Planctomycetaceae bacterium]MBT5124166.1 DUF1501 domain-containing protein [Planctomycetaceae bacterium]MBT5598674.1 DUF1501 domain-containing protein [Planctomycetaceae bacterium]MBT5882753.1 DUF1501 domain-containing protein [Planctomycetaceae bacterium]
MGRREILQQFGMGLGSIALSQLLAPPNVAAVKENGHYKLARVPRAKRIIYLFQSGGPSQLDLFDYKPELEKFHGEQLPSAIRKGQRLTSMSGNQASLPLVKSPFKFAQHGESGQWISEVLPRTAKIADELCIVRSMHTEAINHGPAVTHMQTGSQFPGRPSMGAWLDYGLGTENENLPSFVVLVTKNKGGQPLITRLWGSGFLPSKYQGTRFRSGKDPVLYLSNPQGLDSTGRRLMLDRLRELHELKLAATADPNLEDRIAQYELAFRMQASIPDVTNVADEPEHIFKLYGDAARQPGSFAANCLLARRLAERGVRFIQLYHPGWDQHGGLVGGLRGQAKETDQASAALVVDLKQRGLLEDTIVIWGGEFGRTNYCQGKLTGTNFGRDHHPRCFSLWMAGGGYKGGVTYGETGPLGYNIHENPMHVHDFHATLLHQMGIDHEQLTYRYQGRRFRLTDVHGQVVREIVS